MNKSAVNLKRGKELFFYYFGNHFAMYFDLGDEYRKCNIPKEIEQQWREEIMIALLKQIDNSIGNERCDAVGRYLQLLSNDEACKFLIIKLSDLNMDGFSRLRFCEELRNYLTKYQKQLDINVANNAQKALLINKEKLLREPISVDPSFMQLPYMKDYDFSQKALRERIQQL